MAEEGSYSKNLFTPKNILIYLVVGGLLYGLVYYVFLAKKGGYNYIYPAASSDNTVPEASSAVNAKEMTVRLGSLSDAKISGVATLTETDGGKVNVKLQLSGAETYGDHPAHIHTGVCPTPGAVKYPLTNVGANSTSETTLNVSLDQLKQQLPLAINVHKSAVEINTYLACGDLK